MTTSEEKLKAIAKLAFPDSLKELESYLGMTGYLRQYIPEYAIKANPLQVCKTELLKRAPNKGRSRKTFAAKEAFAYPTGAERVAYQEIQKALTKPTTLVFHDPMRRLYCDLDVSQQ